MQDYGSEVCGMYILKGIEKVQQSAARIFLGLNKVTPLLAIDGDTRWDSCKLRINLAILRSY